MIHYSCDICKRTINIEKEDRYRVLIDIEQMKPGEDDSDLDTDYDDEIESFGLDSQPADDDGLYTSYKFDLCSDCAESYMRDPLSRSVSRRLRFMDN